MDSPQKLTRKELYDLVWSEPLTALAKRFMWLSCSLHPSGTWPCVSGALEQGGSA